MVYVLPPKVAPIQKLPQEILDRIMALTLPHHLEVALTLPHHLEVTSSQDLVTFVHRNMANKAFLATAKRAVQKQYEHEIRMTATVTSDHTRLNIERLTTFKKNMTGTVYVRGKIANPTASSGTISKINIILLLGPNLFLIEDYGKAVVLNTIIREIEPYGWSKETPCKVTIKLASVFTQAIETVKSHLTAHLATFETEDERNLVFKYEERIMRVGQEMADIASPVPDVETPVPSFEGWQNASRIRKHRRTQNVRYAEAYWPI